MLKFGGWILVVLVFVGCDSATKPTSDVERPVPPVVEQPTASSPSANDGATSTLAWNIESGGNDPKVIAQQLRELAGYDIYCLSEVAEKLFDRYLNAVGSGFTSFNGRTCRNDRLTAESSFGVAIMLAC